MKYFDKTGKEYNIDPSKEIARGGEGMIIEIGKSFAAKIYFPDRTPLNEKRANELSVLSSEFIKPLSILYNDKKKEVGFTMNLLKSGSFPIHSTFNSPFCNKNGLDDKWKIDIIDKLTKGMSTAHNSQIIIGDFNGFNLLSYQNKDVFFIDVDSYETLSHKHSGILFDDIRDYLYNGKITKNSDYFSLAILSFYMLTNVHPFKGVHSKFKLLSERMINRIPVFDNDSNLIVPKCYKPISNKFLMDQFVNIFKNGERFPIELTQGITIRLIVPPSKVVVETGDLIIKEMFNSQHIKYVKNSNMFCCIVESDKITVLDTQYKSMFKTLFQTPIDNTIIEVFCTDHKIFALKRNILGYFDNGVFVEMEKIDPDFIWCQQYENILILGYNDSIRRFYLDNVITNRIKNDVVSVFGKQFKKYQGLHQEISGTNFLFYNGKYSINTVNFPFKLQDVVQNGNFGVAEYMDNKQIKYSMFNINGLDISMSSINLGSLQNFAYKKDQFVIFPDRDSLKFYRPMDFALIAKFDCSLIHEDSELFITNAGIIVKTDNHLYLMNKK